MWNFLHDHQWYSPFLVDYHKLRLSSNLTSQSTSWIHKQGARLGSEAVCWHLNRRVRRLRRRLWTVIKFFWTRINQCKPDDMCQTRRGFLFKCNPHWWRRGMPRRKIALLAWNHWDEHSLLYRLPDKLSNSRHPNYWQYYSPKHNRIQGLCHNAVWKCVIFGLYEDCHRCWPNNYGR